MSTKSCIGALASLLCGILCAQDITGDWQGTLKLPAAEIRVTFAIEKSIDGGWKATEFTLDGGSNGVAVDSVTLQGSNLKLTFGRIPGTYEGTISQDGTSIAGTWTQDRPVPLDLELRAKQSSRQADTTQHSS